MSPAKPSNRLTLKDVAQKAGVTPAVISRLLNNDPTLSIKGSTKDAIYAAIKELGYQPNSLARSLRTQKSGMIGLLIVDWLNPFYGELIRSIQTELRKKDLFCIVSETQDNVAFEKEIVRYLCQMQVEGIILATAKIRDEAVEILEDLGVKYVLSTRQSSSSNAPCACFDTYRGMCHLIDHLAELGHRDIAYISGSLLDAPGMDRLNAYWDSLARHGIGRNESYVVESNWAGSSAVSLTQQLLALKKRPTAIVTCNDAIAVNALETIKQAGLSVPGDVSIAGFNNIEFSRIASPSITTVDMPVTELGKKTADLMIRVLEEQPVEKKVTYVKTSIVPRESTGPVPVH